MGRLLYFTTCRKCLYFRRILPRIPNYRCGDCDKVCIKKLEADMDSEMALIVDCMSVVMLVVMSLKAVI